MEKRESPSLSNHPLNKPITYQDAGVNITTAHALVEKIKPIAKSTQRPGIMAGIGGFGALFELPLNRYKAPVLVSGTDGVGTKLKLAIAMKQYDKIGIDLVAMCANDIIVQGAEPLFFLDYYACGNLRLAYAEQIIEGIGEGCQQAGAALIGGETAEMPGVYDGEDYDLAGFCVGIVEKSEIIDGSRTQIGDKLIGLASSGPHANGYSLIRRVLDMTSQNVDSIIVDHQPLMRALLTPTKIYVRAILSILKKHKISFISHITGGGFYENIPRVMPKDLVAEIHTDSWVMPDVFKWIQDHARIDEKEMYSTFNCGIGMVICVKANSTEQILDMLKEHREEACLIGEIRASSVQEEAISLI